MQRRKNVLLIIKSAFMPVWKVGMFCNFSSIAIKLNTRGLNVKNNNWKFLSAQSISDNNGIGLHWNNNHYIIILIFKIKNCFHLKVRDARTFSYFLHVKDFLRRFFFVLYISFLLSSFLFQWSIRDWYIGFFYFYKSIIWIVFYVHFLVGKTLC